MKRNRIFKILLLGLVLLMFVNSSFADIFFFSKKKEISPNILNSTIYKEASYKINVIDPTVATNTFASAYPGLRGNNQLIVYTPKFGLRTSTNEFGSEAIVVNGVVVQLNGADSIIPLNGVVISGHGAAKRWINQNITVGTKVNIDYANNTLNIYLTPESFVFNAKEKIKEVQNIMNDYNAMNIYYDDRKSLYYIAKSKEFILKAQRDEKNVQKYSSLAIMAADRALEYSVPYYPDELRGIWIRPTEISEEQIVKTIDTLKNAGISDIFLETYFHGQTIYPSKVMLKYGVRNQKEDFKGIDPLKIWIKEAHERNIKVHIWFESFYVGNEYSENNPFHVLNVYPKWRNCNRQKYDWEKPVPSTSEHNGYFIDPANPEVQTYLLDILNEIITEYHPDGINLDYIRYPQSVISKYSSYVATNWGYTQFAREEFKQKYNLDPIDIKYPSSDWNLWAQYRQDKITDFIVKVKYLTSRNNVTLSAVIFPDRVRSLETKMQDWRSWSVNSYVDAFTPLILTCDKQTATLLINDIKRNSMPKTKIYPGLFVTFMGGDANDLLRQIHANRKLQNQGIILFDYAHFSDKYVNSLCTSAYNSDTNITLKPDSLFDDKKNKKLREKDSEVKVDTKLPVTEQKKKYLFFINDENDKNKDVDVNNRKLNTNTKTNDSGALIYSD